MGFINLKTIRTLGLLFILGSGTPGLLTRHSVSLAQGRGQLMHASTEGSSTPGGNRSSEKVIRTGTKTEPAVDTLIGAMGLAHMAIETMATMIGVLREHTIMAHARTVMRLRDR